MIQNATIYLFTASFTSKNTRAMYSHKHQKMTMNNILASAGLSTMNFFNHSHF